MFVRPVVKIHFAAFVVPQETLDIRGDLAALGQLHDKFVREIAVQQAGEMVQAAVHVGDLVQGDGVGLRQTFYLAAFPIGGEIGVLHERGCA